MFVEPGRVAGVLLAAGLSSRLGANKLLFRLGTETMVHRAARQAIEAGLSPVIVVLGFESEQVAAALKGLDVDLVVNQHYARGMHTSLEAGISRVPSDCEAAVVMLADMPIVSPRMLAALVTRFRADQAPLVISEYGGVQAPPTLYSRALFPALAEAGEGAGRKVVREHRDQATTLRWSPLLLADLDRPEDLERILALLLETT